MRYQIEVNGRLRDVLVSRRDGGFDVTVDGRSWAVDAARLDGQTWSLLVAHSDGTSAPQAVTKSYEVTISPGPGSGQLAVRLGATMVLASLDGRQRWSRKDEGGGAGAGPQRIAAPMPGKIVRVLVRSGEAVQSRQPLVVVEAMKMENELRAGRAGTVAEVHATEGQSVDAGALLVIIQ